MSMEFDLASVLGRVASAETEGADGKREVYMETLFDWGDGYMENLSGKGDSEASLHARKQISDLWIHYANMEIGMGEHDNVRQVFQDAMDDAAASLVAATYIAAASYYLSRKKEAGDVSEAAKIYQKALSKQGMPPEEIGKLHAAQNDIVGSGVKMEVSDDDLFTPTGGGDYDSMQARATADHFLAEMMKIHESNKVESEDNEESIDGLTPEMLVKNYFRRPPFVFDTDILVTNSNKARSLDPADTDLLERYLGVPLSSDDVEFSSKCEGVLDLLEGLWIMQALKERQYSKWFEDLNQLQVKELKMKEASLGSVDDRTRARSRAAVQKEVLSAIVNKSAWALVQDHHRTLIRVGFPGFGVAILDDIGAYLSGELSAGGAKATMSEGLELSVRRQRALVEAILRHRKGKVLHADGTLPVAAKVDPRLARKRRFASSSSTDNDTIKADAGAGAGAGAMALAANDEREKRKQPKTEQHTSVLDRSKPTTMAGKAKVLPAPDPATLSKLAEEEANPPKRTRAKRK